MPRIVTHHPYARKRGIVVVQVVVMLVVLLGVTALTVDVGAMYNAKADLQISVDAAALAAADALGDYTVPDPLNVAKQRAIDFAHRNKVLGDAVDLDAATDIVFGRATYDLASNAFTFTPTNQLPDAVRVRGRLGDGSPNASVATFFAGMLGRSASSMQAEAIAMMVPRDIAIVADLSASHNDDSELRHYQLTNVNLLDVWGALPIAAGINGVGNGVAPAPAGDPSNPIAPPATGPIAAGNGGIDPGTNPVGGQVGPTFGWMYYWGNTIDPAYDPSADPGLVDLPRYQDWNNADVSGWLTNVGYSANEVNALMSSSYDSSKDSQGVYAWTNRVAVALGLARWDSGMPGGLWESVPNNQGGNGNALMGSSEITWLVNYPFNSGSWNDYIYNYARKSSTKMAKANPNFQYKFGLKTFSNYILERKYRNSNTPELANTPTQPMQAVKDAVQRMANTVLDLQTNDQLSLEIYGTTARHEVDLTTNALEVSNRLTDMQAGHYDPYTNMGGGITRAIEELTSSRSRSRSRKVIILLTDGYANVARDGSYGTSSTQNAAGAAYAIEEAQAAAALGIRIFAVSVGAYSNQTLMQQIADIGNGEHFHAEGTIEQYSAQLDLIFASLGGARPVQLIQ